MTGQTGRDPAARVSNSPEWDGMVRGFVYKDCGRGVNPTFGPCSLFAICKHRTFCQLAMYPLLYLVGGERRVRR